MKLFLKSATNLCPAVPSLRSKGFAILLLPLLSTMPAAANSFSFNPAKLISVGGDADSVVVGDVTGDGLDDVVLVTRATYVDPENDKRILVFIQRADHQLSVPDTYYFPTEVVNKTSLQLEDLNHDGIQDIVLDYQSGVTIMIADGNHGFRAKHLVDTYTRSQGLAILDVDRDGNVDIIWNDWVLLLNAEFDVVRKYTLFTGVEMPVVYNALSVGDLNNDGFPDLAVHFNLDRGLVSVYYHDGVSGFSSPPVVHDPNLDSWPIQASAIGDVDSDGLPDLVVAQHKNVPAWLSVLRQGTSGQILPAELVPTYHTPDSVFVVDLNGDGANDVVTTHGGWGPPSQTFGSSVGFNLQINKQLQPEQLFWLPYASSYTENGMSVGDVNGDGCSDVATANYNYGLLLLYGKECEIRAQADLGLVSQSTGSNFVLKVTNRAGSLSANAPVVTISVDGKRLIVTKFPDECIHLGNARFECLLPTLSQQESHRLEFSISSPADGRKYIANFKATVLTETVDFNKDNNAVAPRYSMVTRRTMARQIISRGAQLQTKDKRSGALAR